MSKTIVILIGLLPDPRIMKQVRVERELGSLHIICWDRGKNMHQVPAEEGYEQHTIREKADIIGNNPLGRVLPYRHFSAKAAQLLDEIQPDLVDVQGLDMLKIAAAYKKRAKKKVSIIYEVPDLQRLIADEQHSLVGKIARAYLLREDKRLSKAYDKLLITSNAFYDFYFSKFVEKERVFYMPNIPDMSAFRNYRRKTDGPFTVGFIGGVRYKDQMRLLVEAAKRTGINTLIAGFENGEPEIENLCKDVPNIEWVGRFNFAARVAELYGKCDAIFSVYDADMQNVRVALPNKLYEAVYCGLPLIVAKGTYLEKMVTDWGVGLGVDHRSADALIDVLKRLRDDRDLYDGFVKNCEKRKGEIDLEPYNRQLEQMVRSLL